MKILSLFLCLLTLGFGFAGDPVLEIHDREGRAQPAYLAGETDLAITGLKPETHYEIQINAGDGVVLGADQLFTDTDGRLDPRHLMEIVATDPGMDWETPLDEGTELHLTISEAGEVVLQESMITVLILPDPATYETSANTWGTSYCAIQGLSGCESTGLLRFPAVQSGWTYVWDDSVTRPLVIIGPGNGFDYDEYTYLQDHLAHNGFVVTAYEETGASIAARASNFISHLNYMFNNYGNKLNGDVVLIGHSRGGEAAMHAVNTIYNNNTHGVDVRAVVGLAPSNEENLVVPGTYATDSLLLMYGSHDEDITGGTAQFSPSQSAFQIFDRSGSEWSYYGSIDQKKAMAFIYGGSHYGFTDQTPWAPGTPMGYNNIAPYIDANDQRLITKGYINAHLRWMVYGESYFSNFIKRKWMPASVAAETYPIDNEYGEGAGDRVRFYTQYQPRMKKVVDNFEDNLTTTNTMGGAISTNGTIFLTQDELYNIEDHSAHDTEGMRLVWWKNNSSTPWATWAIPAGQGDMSDYNYLAIRVGQMYDHPWNQIPEDQDFTIRVFNGWFGYSVSADAYGDIPYPDRTTGDLNGTPWDNSRTHMSTIIVPLSAFNGFDKSNVSGLSLIFDQAKPNGVISGAIVIDSIEFIK